MSPQNIIQTKVLLQRVKDASLQIFHHFPDVILVGKKSLDVEDFNTLVSEKYIKEIKVDSFGKIYGLTKKGEALLKEKEESVRLGNAAAELMVAG